MQFEKRSKLFVWLWVLKESHWDTVHILWVTCKAWVPNIPTTSYSIFGPVTPQHRNCIYHVQLVCISLCRFKKKVKFCGCILVFCSESCSKEFLWWGERVWTNRQADLGNDKHVLPLPDSSSAPLSLSHSFTQDRKQNSFSNCNFEKRMFFIFSLLLIYFFW